MDFLLETPVYVVAMEEHVPHATVPSCHGEGFDPETAVLGLSFKPLTNKTLITQDDMYSAPPVYRNSQEPLLWNCVICVLPYNENESAWHYGANGSQDNGAL